MSELRLGHGVDIHRLVTGRRCILGGVEIPSDVGPEGHSDADVILHALVDALLGAIGESDIGTHFPNTDPKWKDADSIELLKQSWKMVTERGWKLINTDICVIAEAPKLKSYIPVMKERIAKELDAGTDRIGIKATTAEKLGSLGKSEGIFASATVLLER